MFSKQQKIHYLNISKYGNNCILVSEFFRDLERPVGLIGFLASLIDIKTDVNALDTAAYCIWRVAQSCMFARIRRVTICSNHFNEFNFQRRVL